MEELMCGNQGYTEGNSWHQDTLVEIGGTTYWAVVSGLLYGGTTRTDVKQEMSVERFRRMFCK